MKNMLGFGRGIAALALAAVPLALAQHVPHSPGKRAHPPEPDGLTVVDGRHNRPVVTSLRSGGPAEQGGIAVGDELRAVDGHRTKGASAVRRELSNLHRCKVALDLRRDGRPLVATMTRCEGAWPKGS